MQLSDDGAAVVPKYLPAGQLVQLDAPTFDPKFPGAQSTHPVDWMTLAYVPIGQLEQLV